MSFYSLKAGKAVKTGLGLRLNSDNIKKTHSLWILDTNF
jgi:hypothetical protein